MLKKISVLVASLIAIAIVLLFSLIVYIQFTDLEYYKPQLSQRLTQYLDRAVVLDGNVDIKLLPHPSLSLSDAKIVNAQWASKPDMLKVSSLDLQMELLPIILGELVISKLVLDDVVAVVEHSEQGANNWRLFEAKEPQQKADTGQKSLPLDFASDVEVEVKNIALLYNKSHQSPWRKFKLNKATIQGLNARSVLIIDISGQVDSNSYQLQGQVGDLSSLLSAEKKFPVDLRARALNIDVAIKGEFQNLLKLDNMQLNVKTVANDLAELRPWLGVKIDKTSMNIESDIEGNLNKLTFTNLAANIGNASAGGNMSLDLSADKPKINAQLTVEKIHVEDFLDAIQPEPAKKPKTAKQTGNVEFVDKELGLNFLSQFDAAVMVSVASVGYKDWLVDEFKAELNVKNGQLAMAPFSIASKFGQAKGKFSLLSKQGTHVAKLDIDANKLALGKFYDLESKYQGFGALHGSIHSKGKSLSELYYNLQGNATAHYVNKEHKHDTKITLVRSNPKTSSAPFDVVINGELQKVPYKINGEIGGPMTLIGDKPYPATANLKFLNVDTKAKGTIAKLFEAKGFNINFDAHTEDLAKLNKTIDLGLPDMKKTRIRTILRGDYSLLKFDNTKASGKSAQLSGNLSVDFKDKLPAIAGNLRLDKFDLVGLQQEIASTKKNNSNKVAKKENSALETPVSFAALSDFNMNVSLIADNASEINIANFPITTMNTRVGVKNSVLSVSGLNIESPMGGISADFKINANNKVPTVAARVNSSEFDLEQFEADDEEKLILSALAGIDVELQARGDSIQHWLESVTGAVTVNYQHKLLRHTHVIRIGRKPQAEIFGSPVTVRINSKYRETIVQGAGSLSAPHTWLSHGDPTEIEFTASTKGFVGEVQGKIDDIVTGEGMNIRVSVNNDQALAAPSLGQTDLVNRLGKVQVTSEIKGSYSSIVATQLSGNVGEGRISGSTTVNLHEQLLAMDVDLDISGLDISKWVENDKTSKPEQARNKAGTLFSPEKLPFELLNGLNIKGTIKGTNLQFKRIKANNFHTTINLQDGVLRFIVNRLQTPNGVLFTDINVDANAVPPRMSLKLDVPKLNVSEIARNTVAEGLVNGNFGADISVTSAGNSVAELMARLDGHVRLLMDKGTIDSALLNVYAGGLNAMVGMLTATNVKTTKVNCGICGVSFTKGKGVTEVVLLDTQHSTLVAEGWVDFSSETFDFKASPVTKGVSLNMELPVMIRGSITDPKFSTQPTSALYRAAEIATVWLIPTTAIFIGYDGLRSSGNNPCVNMVAPSRDRAGMRAIKGAGKAVEDIGSAFNKGLSKLLGGMSEAGAQNKKAVE